MEGSLGTVTSLQVVADKVVTVEQALLAQVQVADKIQITQAVLLLQVIMESQEGLPRQVE
jgi:hypothetical protein